MADAPGSINRANYALGLHTTSPDLGLGLSNFKGDSRYQTCRLGRDLSTHLHYHLAQFILPQRWPDLVFIAAAKGPGSFTGSRIGIVTGRTLAQQLNIPLFAISTLAAIAWSQVAKSRQAERAITIPVEIPAQRNEVFAAIYQTTQSGPSLSSVLPDTRLPIHTWQQTLETWSLRHQVIRVDDHGPSVEEVCKALLDLAYQRWQQGERPHWSEAIPYYGQPSQAL